MAVVYRARQLGVVEREVAVKLLNDSSLKNEVVVRRFENEAQIIAQLRHPNTLKLIDSGRLADGRLYVVTELLFGEALDRVIERGPLDPSRVARIVRDVCDSLSEAHERGIVHRDLKPANIFLEQVGALEVTKVLDFGIAKILALPGMTMPASIFGTPGYMSPEQCRGDAVDPRSDIFALGAIAYHLLAGVPPFSGDNVMEVLIAQLNRDPTPLDKAAPKLIPPALVDLVGRMMARSPDDRPGDVLAIRAELKVMELEGVSQPIAQSALVGLEAAHPPLRQAPSSSEAELDTAPSRTKVEETVDRTLPTRVVPAEGGATESLDTVIHPRPLTPLPELGTPPRPQAGPLASAPASPVLPPMPGWRPITTTSAPRTPLSRLAPLAVALGALITLAALALNWSRGHGPSRSDAPTAPAPTALEPRATPAKTAPTPMPTPRHNADRRESFRDPEAGSQAGPDDPKAPTPAPPPRKPGFLEPDR
jgi:serine/threonine-protein kinase